MKLALLFLTAVRSLEDPRHGYATRALNSFLNYLVWDGELIVHIADDGSPPEHREELNKIACWSNRASVVSETNAERSGYGGNYNRATQIVHSLLEPTDLVLPLEDDWELTRPLHVDWIASAFHSLKNNPREVGCIRLGYIGYTDLLRCHFAYNEATQAQYLVLDPYSPEKHVWAGHPRLETVAFQRRVGPWPEYLPPGATELSVCGRREAREGVLWPVTYVNPSGDLFAHVGSVKARED